ncbi:APH(3') family aminoglycoside O-phosphotransferase [Micromonospora olivasterospora]|uniref:Kanamycin kinase n=1 Tax=Micromonospora olivasterospora TaxID=1880 RepID=Q2MG02_MICOL|nr:APH(3') family aminoglycoside O-phosphotransferase [Micromonospora olivasterospora]TWH67113.1 kanamycin kinase [Micromonospora olivasterospora]CAF31545.1 putative fortimicin 3'-phosphotransferase (biosynthetic) [Micromonospora olivasterospora]
MFPPSRPPAALAGRLRLDGAWTHVASRSYGTVIHRVDGRRHAFYVKTTPPRRDNDLRFHPGSEAERLQWLAARGFPVAEVVDVGGDDELMWLVTTAVEGRSAAGPWATHERPVVLDVVADVVRALHELPLTDCPFDRTLAVTLPLARLAAEMGWIDLDDLDPQHRGWSARQLLDELTATPPPAVEDLVVCHGDPCLDNFLVAPDTLALTGILDVGRLGAADRWKDLAIAVRDVTEQCADEGDEGQAAAARFLARYGARPDAGKDRFYRLLDEFV